jgi:hypothetical protein
LIVKELMLIKKPPQGGFFCEKMNLGDDLGNLPESRAGMGIFLYKKPPGLGRINTTAIPHRSPGSTLLPTAFSGMVSNQIRRKYQNLSLMALPERSGLWAAFPDL